MHLAARRFCDERIVNFRGPLHRLGRPVTAIPVCAQLRQEINLSGNRDGEVTFLKAGMPVDAPVEVFICGLYSDTDENKHQQGKYSPTSGHESLLSLRPVMLSRPIEPDAAAQAIVQPPRLTALIEA